MGNCRMKRGRSAEFCGFSEPQICPSLWMHSATPRFLRSEIFSGVYRIWYAHSTVALTVIFLGLIEGRRCRGDFVFGKQRIAGGSRILSFHGPTGGEDFADAGELVGIN